MGRYTLEVVEPRSAKPRLVDEEQLESALDAIAVVHGGMVVESSKASARHPRRYVNIFDCESSLEGEVAWLRSQFPDVRFTLREFTSA